MKFPDLKNKFRTAVLSGLAALGMMAGCDQRPTAPPPPNTQILVDSSYSIKNREITNADADWKSRQELYLKNNFLKTSYRDWLSQLDGLKKLPLLEQMERVNDMVNDRVTWTSDISNYGFSEYYASDVETILTGRGDCEDFAIAKFCALRHLGVPESRLAILAVATNPLDSVLRWPSHGVLAIDTSAANNWTNALILNDDETLPSKVHTLGETRFTPCFLFNDKERRGCRVKVLKPSTPL